MDVDLVLLGKKSLPCGRRNEADLSSPSFGPGLGKLGLPGFGGIPTILQSKHLTAYVHPVCWLVPKLQTHLSNFGFSRAPIIIAHGEQTCSPIDVHLKGSIAVPANQGRFIPRMGQKHPITAVSLSVWLICILLFSCLGAELEQ